MSSSSSSSASVPTTRSRTLLFISYRDSSTRSTRFSRPRINTYDDTDTPGDEHEGLINANSGQGSIDLDLPPKWYGEIYLKLVIKGFTLGVSLSCRVDISEQVEDILAGTQAKSELAFNLRRRPIRSPYSSSFRSHITGKTTCKTRFARVHGPKR